MSIRGYYGGGSPELVIHVQRQIRRRRIPYGRLWRGGIPRPLKPPKINDQHLRTAIIDHLFAFDFAHIWLQELAFLTFACLLGDRGGSDQERVETMIAWRLVSDLAGVRSLILSGLDVHAKSIARAVSENLDALALAHIDAGFCSEFIEEQDIDVAHKVWFRRIAKGKARRAVEAHLSKELGFDVEDEYRDQEERLLSASAHPSFVTGIFSVFPHFGYSTSGEEVGPHSSISPHSVRTLSYCNYRVLQWAGYDLAVFKWAERMAERRKKLGVIQEWVGTSIVMQGREVALILAKYFEDFSGKYDLDWEEGEKNAGDVD